MTQSKAAFLDLDGTLIKEISWQILHDYFEVDNQENLEAFKAGKINHLEFMERDIALWRDKWRDDVTMEEVQKALCRIEPRPGAFQLVSAMREREYDKIGIVSGGIKCLAEKIACELQLDFCLANGFTTKGEEEIIVGPDYDFDFSEKGKIVENLARKFEIPIEQTVTVGDTIFDVDMFKVSKGIVFDPKDERAKQAADIIVEGNDLTRLIRYL